MRATLVLTAVTVIAVFATSAAQADDRVVFVYSGGHFAQTGDSWIERRLEGPPSYFVEIERTPDFVELYDQDRNMSVRLYNTYGAWYDKQQGQWVRWPGSKGYWR